MTESEIINFFENQTVFITGGTGFVGKVLVEKILRVCDVKMLYLLVRQKKGKSIQERFDDYFNFPCFGNIVGEIDKNKVVFIEGDCEKPNLGLNEKDEKVLIDYTTVVIHASANVKFDQTLRVAVNINVRSTVDLLNIAKKMQQLKSFVYVSTAFVNCNNLHAEEKNYPSALTPEKLFSILNGIDEDEILEAITPKLIKPLPNSYIFTKLIIESYLDKLETNFPIAIVRPSIVTGSYQEPVPGWIDNFYGIIGITCAAAIGVLRTLHCDSSTNAQVIPVDYVSNCIMAVCYAIENQKHNQLTYYNISLPDESLITYGKYMKLVEKYGYAFPSKKAIWHYSFKLTKNYYWNEVRIFFLHTLLSYVADFFLLVARQPRLAVENYKKLNKDIRLISYFSSKKFTFDSRNVEALWNQLNEKDKQIFNFRKKIDWSFYVRSGVIGGRIYLLKDPLETIPDGARKIWMLFCAHYASLVLFYLILYKLSQFLFLNWF